MFFLMCVFFCQAYPPHKYFLSFFSLSYRKYFNFLLHGQATDPASLGLPTRRFAGQEITLSYQKLAAWITANWMCLSYPSRGFFPPYEYVRMKSWLAIFFFFLRKKNIIDKHLLQKDRSKLEGQSVAKQEQRTMFMEKHIEQQNKTINPSKMTTSTSNKLVFPTFWKQSSLQWLDQLIELAVPSAESISFTVS